LLAGDTGSCGQEVPIQKKKQNASAGDPGPNKEQHPNQHHPSIYSNNHQDSGTTTSKMTSNYNFQHHSQEAELTPRSKSMRENSMPQVTVGAAKGNLEKPSGDPAIRCRFLPEKNCFLAN